MTPNRYRWLLAVTLGAGLAFIAHPLSAQTLPSTQPAPRVPSIPIASEVRTAEQPVTGPMRTGVTAFITAEVRNLQNSDPKVQHDARIALSDAAAPVGGINPQPSATYADAYATDLNTALLPLLKSADVRLKLNVAIVAARVAEKADNARLAPVVLAALRDKAEPVVLWGLKAAQHVVARESDQAPQIVRDPVAAAVVNAVRTFPSSDAVAEEAVNALAGTKIGGSDHKARRANVVRYIVEYLQVRVEAYRRVDPSAAALDSEPWPGSPEVDRQPIVLLAVTAWPEVPLPQKQQIAQALMNLAGEFARLLVPTLAKRTSADDAWVVRREDLVNVLQQIGKGASQIFSREGKSAQQPAAGVVEKINADTPSAIVQQDVTALTDAFRAAAFLPAAASGTSAGK